MNYTFTNKNKRNKDKLLCKNFSKYYFDFLVINNIFQIKNIKIEKKIIFLILVNYHNILLSSFFNNNKFKSSYISSSLLASNIFSYLFKTLR